MYQFRDIVFLGRFILGPRRPRKSVQGHVVSGRSITPPLISWAPLPPVLSFFSYPWPHPLEANIKVCLCMFSCVESWECLMFRIDLFLIRYSSSSLISVQCLSRLSAPHSSHIIPLYTLFILFASQYLLKNFNKFRNISMATGVTYCFSAGEYMDFLYYSLRKPGWFKVFF